MAKKKQQAFEYLLLLKRGNRSGYHECWTVFFELMAAIHKVMEHKQARVNTAEV